MTDGVFTYFKQCLRETVVFLYEIVCIFIINQSKYIISLLIEYFSSSNDQDFCLYVNSFILKVVVIVKRLAQGCRNNYRSCYFMGGAGAPCWLNGTILILCTWCLR